jgi:hypothetical protein
MIRQDLSRKTSAKAIKKKCFGRGLTHFFPHARGWQPEKMKNFSQKPVSTSKGTIPQLEGVSGTRRSGERGGLSM